jgi:hypothetical protein
MSGLEFQIRDYFYLLTYEKHLTPIANKNI